MLLLYAMQGVAQLYFFRPIILTMSGNGLLGSHQL